MVPRICCAGHSLKQKNNLKLANAALAQLHIDGGKRHQRSSGKENVPPVDTASQYQEKLQKKGQELRNEWKRHQRLQKTSQAHFSELKELKHTTYLLRGDLERTSKELEQLTALSDAIIHGLHADVIKSQKETQELRKENQSLKKRVIRLKKIAEKWREKMMCKRVQWGKSWLLQKGVYTQQAQSMACYLASSGMAEGQRTVQWAVLEGGIAADIQLGYEMITAKMDHCSKTQVDILKERLGVISAIFNNSPFAKRNNLQFNPNDFALKLIGTSGDHANDQKKSHEILYTWKMDMLYHRLAERILKMDAMQMLALLLPLKAKQIEDMGGKDVWDSLSDLDKTLADLDLLQKLWKDYIWQLTAK
ncbi:hypothetical protein L208DRAFT_1377958 [Tricholoma matsutake]|nr:hypothetical protein L208DRAFT_1377958 [Tricholoma matsutake 945]